MPKGLEGFQPGHDPMGGRPKGSGGAQTKAWLLGKMRDLLESLPPDEFKVKLRKLMDDDFSDYLNIMIKLMPKDIKADVTVDRFTSWSKEELNHFALTGEYPDYGND